MACDTFNTVCEQLFPNQNPNLIYVQLDAISFSIIRLGQNKKINYLCFKNCVGYRNNQNQDIILWILFSSGFYSLIQAIFFLFFFFIYTNKSLVTIIINILLSEICISQSLANCMMDKNHDNFNNIL